MILYLLIGSTLVCLVESMLNLTILVYGTMSPALLSSVSMAGPAIDMATATIRTRYGFNFSRVYIGPMTAKNCLELARSSEYVGEYFYKNHDHRTPIVLAIPGTISMAVLVSFTQWQPFNHSFSELTSIPCWV